MAKKEEVETLWELMHAINLVTCIQFVCLHPGLLPERLNETW